VSFKGMRANSQTLKRINLGLSKALAASKEMLFPCRGDLGRLGRVTNSCWENVGVEELPEDTLGWAEKCHRLREHFKAVKPEDRWLADLVWHCRDQNIETCYDVGANVGQFGTKLRKFGFTGSILSFEPLTQAHQRLKKTAARFDNWYVAGQMALGDKPGTIDINVSSNLHSSSGFTPSARSIEIDPGIEIIGQETVAVQTLDNIVQATPEIDSSCAALLKIDVQGYQVLVLAGATRALAQARLVFVEMNMAPVYDGAPGFVDVYTMLEARGFECISLNPAFEDTARRRMLQVDRLFCR